MKRAPYRHTKIIFTIGPATLDLKTLEKLLANEVDVCRFNMAHANEEWTRNAVDTLRTACQRMGRKVAFLMDVKGPEIRTGPLETPMKLERNDKLDLMVDSTADPITEGDIRAVSVNYPAFIKDVTSGDTILVDSGLLRLRVEEVMEDRVRTSVRIGGELGSRRHINLPGIRVNLPALTKKDRDDILLGIELGFDFFALSFVREPEDLDILRRFIKENGSGADIIAKIEDQSAITNLDEIIRASDGLMVARGDLGIEIPFESLPLVQRRAVSTCQAMGKPAIVATHMLESMINAPLPTRAEITDVANAVFEQADCVMLSGETTVGKYPAECVEVLNKVVRSIEANAERKLNDRIKLNTPKALMLRSATILSDELHNCALVVFTKRGHLARILSALRPRKSPIYAFTDVQSVFQNLLIYWGVEPFHIEFDKDPEITIQSAFQCLKDKGWVNKGDNIVLVSNVLAGDRVVDTIQYRVLE